MNSVRKRGSRDVSPKKLAQNASLLGCSMQSNVGAFAYALLMLSGQPALSGSTTKVTRARRRREVCRPWVDRALGVSQGMHVRAFNAIPFKCRRCLQRVRWTPKVGNGRYVFDIAHCHCLQSKDCAETLWSAQLNTRALSTGLPQHQVQHLDSRQALGSVTTPEPTDEVSTVRRFEKLGVTTPK
jgi:hypothetical protein